MLKNRKILILTGLLLLTSSIVTPYWVSALSATNVTAGNATTSTATVSSTTTSTTTAKSTNKATNTSGLDELRVDNKWYSYTEMSATEAFVSWNFKDDEEEWKMCDFTNNGKVDVSDVSRFQDHCSITKWWNSNKCDLNGDKKFNVSDVNIFNNKCIGEEILWKTEVNCEDPTIVLACLDPEADVYQNCPKACRTNINCDDPAIVLACLDPDMDIYQDCPNACKPDGILTNNLTKTVEFKSNEVITRTVFDWSIKALKDISINDYTIDTMAMYQEGRDDTYFEQRCQKNKTNMTFYIYIDWKLVWSTYYEDACNLGQWAWFGHIFDNINIKKWQSKTVKVELEINGYVQEDDMYNFTLYFTDKNWNIPHYWAKSISAKLAPVKILARDNEFSIQTPSKQDTVYLKSKNSTLAEFTLKPSKWNSAYLNELSLDIDISLIKDDDITLLIDNTEQELTSLKNHTFTYQPDMEISSKWVNVKLILNQELEYDDYTVWTKIKSINWKSINKSFSKRFVSVLVYIAKQENRWDHTKFTLWIEKYDDNYFTNFVCLLTSTWTHAGTCFPGHSSWSYEDWYTFTVNNSVLDQNINFIRYQINSSVMSWWGDNITIEREDYPDYFKTKTWEPWKIYWSTPGETTYGNLTSWQVINAWYTTEMKEAYQFAKSNWITTIHDINKAKMNLPLTRIAMAKMLSNYAINVLWKSPDLSKWTPVFNDVTNKLNKQYDNAVTLSYQLGIMWINMKNNNFRPYDEVTRAEFATALSRMLYNTEDWKWSIKYYEPHISKLYNEWIITNKNGKMKEKRWYVMTMLMRTAE